MKTKDAAIGKWHGILTELGVDPALLTNKQSPCPLCGGKDRFRFDDKNGVGTYYCNQCGAGDGFKLAMNYTNMNFKDCAKLIDGMIGNIDARPVSIEPERDLDAIKQRLNSVFFGLVEVDGLTPVRRYLKKRGLPPSKFLRYHPALSHDVGDRWHSFPTMVAQITGSDGRAISYHLTALTDTGEKAPVKTVKRVMKGIDTITGAAIRLSAVEKTIGIAEGIETALAATELFGVPCWAAISANGLESFIPPEGVENVLICGDVDRSYTGQAAAYSLAKRLSQKYTVQVKFPDLIGDFADVIARDKGVA